MEYTLALAMASLVVTGLFVASADFVTDQRTGVVRTELGVVGQQLASDVAGADRLVRASDDPGRLSINASLPSEVAGAQYTITVADAGSAEWLNLTATDLDVAVSVRVDTETDLAPGAVDGGPVRIVYVPGSGLEVRG